MSHSSTKKLKLPSVPKTPILPSVPNFKDEAIKLEKKILEIDLFIDDLREEIKAEDNKQKKMRLNNVVKEAKQLFKEKREQLKDVKKLIEIEREAEKEAISKEAERMLKEYFESMGGRRRKTKRKTKRKTNKKIK